MSMMADKKVGKETFVPIYDSIHKTSFNHGNNQTERKNHLVQQRRHKHKDGFQEPYGQEFQGQEYTDYIRHIAIGSMGFSPGIIEHCRDGEVAGKGTIPNV